MPKNIEIKIEDEVYERLKNESVKYNMDIQSYIPIVIEKYDHNARKNSSYIEEKVKKPLKKILTDLEGLSGYIDDNSNSTKVLLVPFKIYTKPLPRGFNRLIEYYKLKGWYDVETFYLITDGKSILGYIGLNINEEEAPYGRYLYIYGLKLYKEYQTSNNLKYIINFIKSIGRKDKCYSIDILFENTNLTYDQLKELGFSILTVTDIIKIRKDSLGHKINIESIVSNISRIEDIKKFVPVARNEPFIPFINQLLQKKDKIEVYSNIYKSDSDEIEFMYIREDKKINNIIYNHFTLLVASENLYDDKYIGKVFSIFNSIIDNHTYKNQDNIVSILRDNNRNLSIYNEDYIIDTLSWLRKNNS